MRNKNSSDFFDRVYKIVEKIPYGKVTTYGLIAETCGIRSSARTVGWALNKAKNTNLPCHRVVNRKGELTGKLHFADPTLMQSLLISEGVEFINEHVNMEKHLWIPSKNKLTKTNNAQQLSKRHRLRH